MYILRWYWIRACPMMCEWWCNSFFYRSEFFNNKKKQKTKGGRSISSSGEERRRPKMKTKLATEREWWCANDLPITQGSRTCLDFTKWTRAMCKPDTRSYSPHLANYLERFLLLLLLACGDTYVLCVVEWAHTHSSTKPQDKTVKFLGQMIRIYLIRISSDEAAVLRNIKEDHPSEKNNNLMIWWFYNFEFSLSYRIQANLELWSSTNTTKTASTSLASLLFSRITFVLTCGFHKTRLVN